MVVVPVILMVLEAVVATLDADADANDTVAASFKAVDRVFDPTVARP
jgi:hypothetical protein